MVYCLEFPGNHFLFSCFASLLIRFKCDPCNWNCPLLGPTFLPEVSSSGRWRCGMVRPGLSISGASRVPAASPWGVGLPRVTRQCKGHGLKPVGSVERVRKMEKIRVFSFKALGNSKHGWNQPRLLNHPRTREYTSCCTVTPNRTTANDTTERLPYPHSSILRAPKHSLIARRLLFESTEKQWQRQCWSCQFQVDLVAMPKWTTHLVDPQSQTRTEGLAVDQQQLPLLCCWDDLLLRLCVPPVACQDVYWHCIDTVLKWALLQWS